MSHSEIIEKSSDIDTEDVPLKSASLPESPETSENPASPISYFQLFQGTGNTTKVFFAVGTAFACASGGIFAMLFLLMGEIYDERTEEDEDDYDMYHEICKIVYCWTLLGAFLQVSGYISAYCFTRISQEIGLAYRTRYFHAILSKDISYFDTHNSAELPWKLSRDCELIEGGAGDKFMFFLEAGSFSACSIVIVFMKSPQLFLIAFSLVPLILFGGGLFGFGLLMGPEINQKAYAKAGAISEESLGDVKTVAAFNAQEHVSKKYDAELEPSMQSATQIELLKGVGWGITWMAWMLSGAVMFWVPAKWISDERKNWIWGDQMEGVDVIVTFWTTLYIGMWLGSIVPGLAASIEARTAGGRAEKFIGEPVEFVNGTRQSTIEGRVEFHNVCFAYPKQPDRDILNGLNFVCEKGQKTAIVGESGAGKSTIIQLMERFYEPSSGEVFFDGVPVKQFDIGYLRKQVGYVSQEPVLFNLTIEENLLLGNPSASFQDIEAAAKEANAFDFIISLQDGFLTNVGAKGSKLSGGQKQRIAIARAMIKNPKILLLDEATSALDNESEEGVLRALNTIHKRQGVTMVSVAQKLSTVRNSDKIVVLRNGTVEEEGTHQELAHKGGVYATMCTAQGIDVEDSLLSQTVQVTSQKYIAPVLDLSEISTSYEAGSPLRSFPFLRIYRAMLTHWPLLFLGILSSCSAGVMFPVLGFCIAKLTGYILDPAGDTMECNVRKFAIWLIILSSVTLVSFAVLSYTFGSMAARLTKSLRQQTFLKMLHLDADYLEKKDNNAAMLTQRLHSDSEKVNEAGGPLLGSVLRIIVSSVVGLGVAIYWQWRLGLLMAVVLPIQSFGVHRGNAVRLSGVTHPKHQRASAFATDSIMNVKTVKAFQMQEHMEVKYRAALQRVYEDTKSECHWNGISYGCATSMAFWGFALSFWYGGYLKMKDQAGEEDVNIAIFSTFLTILGITISSSFSPGLASGSRAATRIFQIIDYKPKIDSMDNTGVKEDIKGNISFHCVGFKYQGRDNMVLENVTFELPVGRRIGITGASGSGKTTITQLLLRFYDTTEGSIAIDGIDIRQYNIQHLRASIAMVGQEPVLFSGTIRSNVDFGLGKSDEDIKQALIHASIPRFADELDREVGTRGNLVSGGQKQRIAIARAILRSPKILLLDEATSALDTKTEKKILGALEYAGQGKTVLVIAHRLSTIEKCDEILVMEAGLIKERGTHEELKRQVGSIYLQLLASLKE